MHTEAASSEWMRIKKFLSYLAKETGERLGWHYTILHAHDQDLKIPFITSPHDGDSTTHKESICHSKIFHSDGWYQNDELGTHFVSFGNGANYIPHGYPSIAGTLLIIVGEARTILVPPKNSRRKLREKRSQKPDDLLTQERYQSSILLLGLHDGTLAVADEHLFFPPTLALLQEQLERHRRKIDYALPGVIVPRQESMLAVEEYRYHKEFVSILAEHLVTQIICATEGLSVREPILRLLPSTQ